MAGVHGIVRGHKGAIQVSSEPGKGTTFRVLFPASGPAAPAARSESTATPVRSSGTVLVVDDEETIRISAQRMIERSGFSVLTASGGREAIRLFREHQHEVSCVLLDLTMPDMDGAETFGELRRIRPDVRVILTSGYSEEAATERFFRPRAGWVHSEALSARHADRTDSGGPCSSRTNATLNSTWAGPGLGNDETGCPEPPKKRQESV